MRGLIAHEDEGYREWGASGSVRIDPGASGRGLSLTLSPAWGAAASGTERLWGLRDASGLAANDAFDPGHRLDAEVGYGFSVLDGRAVATPYAGWSRSSDRETLRLGQRLRLGQATEWRLEGELGEDERTLRAGYGYRLGSGLTFTTEASRRESANDGRARARAGLAGVDALVSHERHGEGVAVPQASSRRCGRACAPAPK